MTIIPATKEAIPMTIFSIFILLVLFQLSGEGFSGLEFYDLLTDLFVAALQDFEDSLF